jgi:hypothetical protein
MAEGRIAKKKYLEFKIAEEKWSLKTKIWKNIPTMFKRKSTFFNISAFLSFGFSVKTT